MARLTEDNPLAVSWGASAITPANPNAIAASSRDGGINSVGVSWRRSDQRGWKSRSPRRRGKEGSSLARTGCTRRINFELRTRPGSRCRPRAGGMMRLGSPTTPARDVLDAEIQRISIWASAYLDCKVKMSPTLKRWLDAASFRRRAHRQAAYTRRARGGTSSSGVGAARIDGGTGDAGASRSHAAATPR